MGSPSALTSYSALGYPAQSGKFSVLMSLGLAVGDIAAFWSALENGRVQSLFKLDPIRAKLQTKLSPSAVSGSGVKLLLATVGLESGNLFVVNEKAVLCSVDANGDITPTSTQVDLRDAVIASAAIPGIFPPVQLGSDFFVDGGIRDVLPIRAALAAGADQVMAIVAAPSGADPPTELNPTGSGTPTPITSFAGAPIWDIIYRSLAQIMPDQIQQDNISVAVNANATIIQPEINVNDSFTIDPGLIRIAAGYGYMKAAECIDHAPSDLGTLLLFLALSENSKGITSLRKQIWLLEYGAAGQRTPYQQVTDPQTILVPDPSEFLQLRQLKTQVLNLVNTRIQLFGSHPRIMVSASQVDFGNVGVNSTLSKSLLVTNTGDGGLPADVSDWWLQFEKHPWNNPAADNPWGNFISRAGTIPATSPPQLATALGALHITSVVSSDTPVFVAAVASNTIDALASAALVVTFSPTAAGPAAGTINIGSDDPDTPYAQISVTGQSVDLPAGLVVTPGTLNFGSVPQSVGDRTLKVVVSNPGSTALTVNAPVVTGADGSDAFSTDWATPRTLDAYSTNIMNVTFIPYRAGGYSGTLSIQPQTAGIASASVTLVGRSPIER